MRNVWLMRDVCLKMWWLIGDVVANRDVVANERCGDKIEMWCPMRDVWLMRYVVTNERCGG